MSDTSKVVTALILVVLILILLEMTDEVPLICCCEVFSAIS